MVNISEDNRHDYKLFEKAKKNLKKSKIINESNKGDIFFVAEKIRMSGQNI